MAGLTVQELDFLQEQLRLEQWMVKKYKLYARHISDPQLQAKFQQIAACHQNHYHKLKEQLN